MLRTSTSCSTTSAGKHAMQRRQALGLLTGFPLWPLAAPLGLSACAGDQPYQQIAGMTMGTRYHIRFKPPSRTFNALALKAAVDARLEQLNASLSTYRPDSLITAFNRAPIDQPMPIDVDFERMLSLSRQVYQASAGAFDPTVWGLVQLWGFGWPRPEHALTRLPSPSAIEAAKGRFEAVDASVPGMLLKKEPLQLDFSAIAKGYGVDLMADILTSHGVSHFMAEIGGEVATRGNGPTDGPWRIGIESPEREASGRILARISMHDGHLATSGDYRNFFELDGRRFSHVINPVSGYPVQNPPVSVSVLASSVALADAWATALMVLDEPLGMAAAESQALGVFWVYDDNGAHRKRINSRMDRYIDLID